MAVNRARPIRLPPADLASHALPHTRQVARSWYRIHLSAHSAIYFSLVPTHRFSHPDCPHKFLYVAIDPQTCLWERFGDLMFDGGHALPRTQWEDTSVSAIDVPPLHLCDLANTNTRGALTVDLTALMNDDISVPQQWGLAIQNHPSQVPAIKFKSRFTGSACLALFEKGALPKQLIETSLGPLSGYEPALSWLAKSKISLI
jgi:RES domain